MNAQKRNSPRVFHAKCSQHFQPHKINALHLAVKSRLFIFCLKISCGTWMRILANVYCCLHSKSKCCHVRVSTFCDIWCVPEQHVNIEIVTTVSLSASKVRGVMFTYSRCSSSVDSLVDACQFCSKQLNAAPCVKNAWEQMSHNQIKQKESKLLSCIPQQAVQI